MLKNVLARCEGCDYESMSRGALARHVASCRSDRHQAPSTPNSASKMFECDVCNMRFSNGANMRRHKMRHTGVKPYECRVCGKRYVLQIILFVSLPFFGLLRSLTLIFKI